MTARMGFRRETLTRVAVVIAMSLALLGAAIAGRDIVADESAQARTFVADGQRALARDDRASAVLSLERARWLAPREPFVRAAIAAADVNEAEPFLPRAARLLTSREWSAIATTFGWLSGLGIALVVAGWRSRYAVRGAVAAGCAFVIGMTGIMESNASAPGVVTGSDTQMLVAPYPSAVVEKALPAGTMVVVGSRYDAFVHVKAGDGATGWVPRDRVEPIAGSEG